MSEYKRSSPMKSQRGSLIILAIVAALVLSVIMAGGLMVTNTETFTTHNLYMNKNSFYTAVQGLEVVTDRIRNTSDPSTISVHPGSNVYKADTFTRRYQTGTLIDMQTNQVPNLSIYRGFDPPPLVGVGLGTSMNIAPVVWDVRITSEVTAGSPKASLGGGQKTRQRSYTELEAGVYTTVVTGY